MLVGLFALVTSSLTACSVEVPAEQGAGAVASELGSTGDLPILVCPSPAVDVTATLPLHSLNQEASGAVDASQACDWFVLELTGTLGGDIVLKAKSGGVNAVVPNEAKCNASMMSARVTGQLPGYFSFENGAFVYHPGAWETITTFSERGVWFGTACAFPAFQQIKNLSSGMIVDSPHTRIRVATRAIMQTANGSVATPLTSIAERKDY